MGTLRLTSDILPIVRLSARQSESNFDDAGLERILSMCLNEFIRLSECSRGEITYTLTANDPEIDLTDSAFANFEISRYVIGEVSYNDRGAWSDATTYNKNDLVTNNGLFYVSDEDGVVGADTEPGTTGGSAWSDREWTRGTELREVSLDDMRGLANGRRISANGYSGYAHRHRFNVIEGAPLYGDISSPGRPSTITFTTTDKAYVNPVPDIAYPLTFIYLEKLIPSSAWVYGSGQDITFNIPDEFMESAAWYGPAAYITQPENPTASGYWQNFLRVAAECKSKMRYESSTFYKNVSAYL